MATIDTIKRLISWRYWSYVEAAMQAKSDWYWQMSRQPCVEPQGSSELVCSGVPFYRADYESTGESNVWWVTGLVYYPMFRVCDGDVFLGIEGIFDCGESYCEQYYPLEDLADDVKMIGRFLRQQALASAVDSIEAYLQWCKETGKHPYRAEYSLKDLQALLVEFYQMKHADVLELVP